MLAIRGLCLDEGQRFVDCDPKPHSITEFHESNSGEVTEMVMDNGLIQPASMGNNWSREVLLVECDERGDPVGQEIVNLLIVVINTDLIDSVRDNPGRQDSVP